MSDRWKFDPKLKEDASNFTLPLKETILQGHTFMVMDQSLFLRDKVLSLRNELLKKLKIVSKRELHKKIMTKW